MGVPFYTPTGNVWHFVPLFIFISIWLFSAFYFRNAISLMTYKAKYLFTCSLAIGIYYSVKCLLESFAHLKKNVFIIYFYFLLTMFTFKIRREILHKSSFLRESFLSFQSVGFLFLFLAQFSWLGPIVQHWIEEMKVDTLVLLVTRKLSVFHQWPCY